MLNHLSIRARLLLIIGVMSVLAIVLTIIGLIGIKYSNDNLSTVYADRLLPVNQLSEIKARQLDSRLRINSSIIFPEDDSKTLAQINENVTEIAKLWEAYKSTVLVMPEESKLAEKFEIARKRYKEQAILPAIELIQKGNTDETQKLIVEKVRPLFEECNKILSDLIQFQLVYTKALYDATQATYTRVLIGSIIALVLGLGLCVWLGFLVIRGLSTAMNNAQNVVTAISNGDLDSRIILEGNDEITVLLKAMQSMQNNLKTLVSEINQIVSAAVLGDFGIKINEQGKNGFELEISSNLNKLSRVVDEAFHDTIRVADALSRGDLQQKVTKDYKGLFGLTAKGVNGTVDSLTKIVNEIQSMVDAAANHGEFSYKMNLNDKVGYTKTIAELLNQLSNVTEGALSDIEHIANALADGDLTQTITKDYPGIFGRVKTGVNQTTENLKTVMMEIKETTNVISSVAQEISSGNNDLSHRTEEQAASLEETAASMQELTSTVQHNSENARQANELAANASQTANKGVTVVQDVVSTMENINESSLRIVDIISVIDDIAFQTNILALNAAVEAARAGEQGKGFAVVATEVRNLAQRAANAAGEIKRLINDSVERVSGGSRQVAEAGKTMQDIVDEINKVTAIISEIASASEQQNSGISQVGQAIGSMDEVTQQNAALVEQVAATAESLESQTTHLAKEMSHFQTGSEKSRTKAVSVAKTVSMPVQKAVPTANKAEIQKESLGTFTVGADDWEEF